MCFACRCPTGFWLRKMTLKLSHNKVGHSDGRAFNSRNKWVLLMSLGMVFVIARYSDSQIERDTIGYFLELQDTRFPPKKKMSSHKWTSSFNATSTIHIGVSDEIGLGWMWKFNPWVSVPLTYQMIRFSN